MQVTFLTRRPRKGINFSVEHIVKDLIASLDPEFAPLVAVSRFESNGLLRRLYNVVEARSRQGDINHVFGDVNFLTYMLDKDRTVLTILDCGRIAGPMDLRKGLIRLLWFRIPARRCAAITVISAAVKQELLTHVDVDPSKVHVIPVAVPSVYRPVPKVFNSACPRILQIGTGPNKNVTRLIEAIAPLSCTLDVVGILSPELRAQLHRSGVQYRNFVNLSDQQIFERYSECDLVAFASTFEGFGMPIVEANRVGRPVVTSRVASMPEVAGSAACLVDPLDVASIRAGIEEVIRNAPYREQLVTDGFENARRFELPAIATMYEMVYRQVAAQGAL